jgi:hypothetical protein
MIYNLEPISFSTIDEHDNTMKKLIDILRSTLARFILISEILITIYILFEYKRNYLYSLLSCTGVIIILDGYYILIKRGGKEYNWFSLSTFLYTLTVNLSIFSLMFDTKLEHSFKIIINQTVNVIDDYDSNESYLFYVGFRVLFIY